MKQATPMLLNGNHAVSWAARLARPHVVPVYPITPQTPILELITEFQSRGEMNAEILTPESEHSVLSASIAASRTGRRRNPSPHRRNRPLPRFSRRCAIPPR